LVRPAPSDCTSRHLARDIHEPCSQQLAAGQGGIASPTIHGEVEPKVTAALDEMWFDRIVVPPLTLTYCCSTISVESTVRNPSALLCKTKPKYLWSTVATKRMMYANTAGMGVCRVNASFAAIQSASLSVATTVRGLLRNSGVRADSSSEP
jgi:hypothetical protein